MDATAAHSDDTAGLIAQTSVYGVGYDEPGFGPKAKTAGKKRPNPEEEAALKVAMGDTDYAVSDAQV